MAYEILFHPIAQQELNDLDGSVRQKVIRQIAKLRESPRLGEELGNRAGMNLTGYRKLYVDNRRVRIVYEIIEDEVRVYIIAIGKREDMQVYRDTQRRIPR
ncbi:MAG: type II toxin-antitoxin system RelE/ParE family toxin [Spirochaetota bacterium]|mgnify:FL=1